jgi:hypothetical protein
MTPKGWESERPIEYWTDIFGDILGGNATLPADGIDLWYYDSDQKWKRYAATPYPSTVLSTMVDTSFEFWKALYEEFPAPDADLRLEIRRLITRYGFWFSPPSHNVFCLTNAGWVTVGNGEPVLNHVECYTRKFVSGSGVAIGSRETHDDPRLATERPTDLEFFWSYKSDILVWHPQYPKALHKRYPAPVGDLQEFIEIRLRNEEPEKPRKSLKSMGQSASTNLTNARKT